MFPLTRLPFWYRFFEAQPYECFPCHENGDPGSETQMAEAAQMGLISVHQSEGTWTLQLWAFVKMFRPFSADLTWTLNKAMKKQGIQSMLCITTLA